MSREFDVHILESRIGGWSSWLSLIRWRLRQPRGVLLGESAVLSTCVHLLKHQQPGVVTVLTEADAGQVFYHRRRRGEVLHLDVFHALGDIDHRLVARFARQAICAYHRRAGDAASSERKLADYVDVQTATGGGRITGTLNFGRRATLQRAHRNHVHLTALLPERHLLCVFYLLAAVEQAIACAGYELRKVEGLEHERAGEERISLNDYASPSDSFLRDVDTDGPRSSGYAPTSGAGVEGPAGGGGAGGSPNGFDAVKWAELRAAAVALANQLESSALARNVLEVLRARASRQELLAALERQGIDAQEGERALAALAVAGFLQQVEGQFELNERGRRLADYVIRHGYELQLALRKAVRRQVRDDGHRGRRRTPPGRRADGRGMSPARRLAVPRGLGDPQDVAWPESIVAAAKRQSRADGRFRLLPEDLRITPRRRHWPVDVFLLIDASASMAGERMRAAKALARHLLVTTRDRVAVITFQERCVRITVPLTRNATRVERGLAAIRPFGLTPMASGLAVARDYVRSVRPRNPLVILITDGIPTVPHDGKNPLDDAIKQAARWRETNARFACVGLQPNERYLRDLIEAAGGTLHIVDELEASTLVAIATAERRRRVRVGDS